MSESIPWQWRRDLLVQRNEAGGWIVRDPLGNKHVFLEDHEYSAARMLDGATPMDDWIAAVQSRFPQYRISAGFLNRFLQSLVEQNVLSGTGTGLSTGLLDFRQRTKQAGLAGRLSSIFRIQIPLFDPTPVLNFVQPLTRMLFSRTIVVIGIGLLLMATTLLLIHFSEFRRTLPDFMSIATRETLPLLVLLFVLIKSLHEFGHAVACHHFGARCRSCGIMFLVLTPVLFTDASDSWSLSRRQRMVVTAAGIVVELIIAAFCMLLWTCAADGPVRTLLAAIVVLCTVTTIAFNANPLLRFDGYFLLADAVSVPNLYQHGVERTGQLFRWLLFGIPQNSRSVGVIADRWRLITTFGLCALAYRIMVAVAIIKMVIAIAGQFGQERLGTLGAAGVLVTFLALPLIGFLKRAFQQAGGTDTHTKGKGVRVAMFLGIPMLLTLVPLPYHVIVPCLLVPDGDGIYVTEPGTLRESALYGDRLEPGDTIATLDEEVLKRSRHEIQAELEQQRILLTELQRRSTQNPRDLTTLADEIAALKEQLELANARVGHLSIRAASAGCLLPPPYLSQVQADSDLSPWFGLPLERGNVKAWLSRGTLLGFVGRPDQIKVLIFVDEARCSDVVTGSQAIVRPRDGLFSDFSTVIDDVAPIEPEQIPQRLVEQGVFKLPSGQQTVFRATCTLQNLPSAAVPEFYSVGLARVSAKPRSIWQRVVTQLKRDFPFLN